MQALQPTRTLRPHVAALFTAVAAAALCVMAAALGWGIGWALWFKFLTA